MSISTKDEFRTKTIGALHECARWVDGHADELTERIVSDEMGCGSWSLSFSFDPDRFPCVVVDTDCRHVALIESTYH